MSTAHCPSECSEGDAVFSCELHWLFNPSLDVKLCIKIENLDKATVYEYLFRIVYEYYRAFIFVRMPNCESEPEYISLGKYIVLLIPGLYRGRSTLTPHPTSTDFILPAGFLVKRIIKSGGGVYCIVLILEICNIFCQTYYDLLSWVFFLSIIIYFYCFVLRDKLQISLVPEARCKFPSQYSAFSSKLIFPPIFSRLSEGAIFRITNPPRLAIDN